MQGKLFYNKLTKSQEKVATRRNQHKFGVCPETGSHLAVNTRTNIIRMEVAGIEAFTHCKPMEGRLTFPYHEAFFLVRQTSNPSTQQGSKLPKLKSGFLEFISPNLNFFGVWVLKFGAFPRV